MGGRPDGAAVPGHPDAGQREQVVRDLWQGEGCRIRRHRKVARDARLRTLSERPRGQEDHRRAHEDRDPRSEEHTSELQSLMRIAYAVFCLIKTIAIYLHSI